MPLVVIPWRGGDAFRWANLRWVLARYAQAHPDWSITIAHDRNGEWVKARAVTPEIEAARHDVIVVADADVWCNGLAAAVSAVQDGTPWAIPHRQVRRLTRMATAEVLAGAGLAEQPTLEAPYDGARGGGIVVGRRDTLLDVPLDPRFKGWGGEDISWGYALRSVAGRPYWGQLPLYHLWHPPQKRISRATGSTENRELQRRYARAKSRPQEMQQLLEEAKQCLEADLTGHRRRTGSTRSADSRA